MAQQEASTATKPVKKNNKGSGRGNGQRKTRGQSHTNSNSKGAGRGQPQRRPSSQGQSRSTTPHQQRATETIGTFAFSSFQNSPDPSSIPIPSFLLDTLGGAVQAENGKIKQIGSNPHTPQSSMAASHTQQLPPEEIAAMSEHLKRMIGLDASR